MTPIRRIVCCCSNGLGSSMMVQMSIETLLKEHNLTHITVMHCSLSTLFPNPFDLVIVGQDLEGQVKEYDRSIVLHNLIDRQELKEKLSKYLQL